MCGIAGVLYRDLHRPVEPSVLRSMGEAIAHRGPDAEGFLREPGVGLVHRRLSIIDLAGGDQPLANEDGTVQVVFNGEIYNFLALREKLLAVGHRFRTRSDTEVLVHLYEEHGADLVQHLRGMFAFAIWDSRQRKLLLARDRIGIKPLYIYKDNEKLVFGSELKAILAHPEIERAVDITALEDYLAFGFISGSRSIFNRVEKLPPAHVRVVTVDNFDAASQRYWTYPAATPVSRSVEDWKEAVAAKVAETVRSHLVADVPVGAFLSGGVDSSVVVAEASAVAREPLQTFSIGFADDPASELPFAREVADKFHCRHSEEIVAADAARGLNDLVKHFDEPFADGSAIPTMKVARLAQESVKVVLSGDGGDEAFGGYRRYIHDLREARLRNAMPGWMRGAMAAPLARVWPKADWLPRVLRAKTLLTNLAMSPAAAYANTLAICRMPWRRKMVSAEIASRLDGFDPATTLVTNFNRFEQQDCLARMIAADVNIVLPDDFLTKVDRASMAFGLEVRPPLVDHELFELTAQIPSKFKVRRGEGKWIFKQIYSPRLPASICRRSKRGFEIPIDQWLRGPLRDVFEDTVLQPRANVNTWINQSVVRRLYQSHLKGLGRNGDVLWSVLVLARWCDSYLDSSQRHAVSGVSQCLPLESNECRAAIRREPLYGKN